jgi:hypothetical protein
MLAEFQTQVPEPLRQNLKELLSAGSMRNPTIGVLLSVFISQHCLKGATMHIQIQHIFGGKGRSGQGRGEKVVNGLCPLLAHSGEADVAGLVATISRTDGPAGESGTSGQSKRARVVWLSGWVDVWEGEPAKTTCTWARSNNW